MLFVRRAENGTLPSYRVRRGQLGVTTLLEIYHLSLGRLHEVSLRMHVAVHHGLRAIYLCHGPRRQHLHLMVLRVQVLLTDLVRRKVAARHSRI